MRPRLDAIGGSWPADPGLHGSGECQATEYSRYGSDVFKQVFIYGGLDRGTTELTRNWPSWSLSGWLLTPFLGKLGLKACCACVSGSATN